MLFQIKTINGQKTIIPLTADTGTGAPVGSLIAMYKKSSPSGYLYCDGSTFDETKYPALYQYLGSNVLPDYREFALVGAEQNTTDTIADHDVYTEGQFKDDQLQSHDHARYLISDTGKNLVASQYTGTDGWIVTTEGSISYNKGVIAYAMGDSGRKGTVTRGKRKAVYFYIKATSGLTENQQENVLNTINENLSYSTTEHKTGKKWIDGKDIYEKVVTSIYNVTTTSAEYRDTGAVLPTFNKLIKCELIGDLANVLYYSNESGSTVKIASLGTFQISAGAQFNLEYTKTTD